MAKTLTGIGYSTQNQIDYRKQLESILNNKKKELVRQQQQEIIKVYEKAYKDIIEKGLKKAGGDKAKIDKLTKVYAEQIYNELELIVKQYNADMSSTIETMQAEIMMSMNIFEKGDYYEFKEAVDKAVNVANRKIVQQMIEGKVYHDGKGLDKRIWDSSKMSGTKMRDAINSCIAQGMGAAEMSQNLKEFAMGGHHTWSRNKIREKLGDGYARKYGSGGLDYEALRLARTTLTHQAQISVINSSKINPYLQFVKWHSNHQAGRTCQQCIDRDGQLFKIDEVPLDHPNGMCWIQPVYSIDGKTEATPEQIAKDMKAWAEGSKNSKRMDTIPEYKGLGGTHKVKEKPQGKEKGLVFTDEERTKQYRKFKRFLQRELPEMGPEYNVDALILRLQQAPKNVQDMYLTVGGKFKIVDSNKPGAYYSPGDKKIHMSLRDKHNNKIRFGDEHRYDVLFHEWGHLMDNQWKKKTSKFMKFKGRDVSTKLSTKSKLCASLEEDMNNWMDNYAKTKFPGRKAPQTLLKNKFNEFLNDNEKHTIAIQDGIRGITGGDIRTRWGHDLKYYKRNVAGKLTEKDSVHLEVSSELFAEVSAGMMHEDTRQFLETNFPNLTKEYNNMVDTILKQYLKDMEGW